jgi:MoxR-like ATPase
MRANIERVFLGHPLAVAQTSIALLSRGHLLVEDVPGVGKTVLARAVARSIDCNFSRIQLTPDMLPSDILGVSVFNDGTRSFEFKRGPIFANVVLADEINRATPRTQAALLEVMNESQISIDGTTHILERPFILLATQNPFEFEGTYFLPENQLDRFTMRIRIGYPGREAESRIVRERPGQNALEELEPVMSRSDFVQLQDIAAEVRVDDQILAYALDLVEATRNDERLEVGVSPRGTLALIQAAQASALLDNRDYVVPDDVKSLVIPVMAHRVVSQSHLHDGRAGSHEQIIQDIVDRIEVPA